LDLDESVSGLTQQEPATQVLVLAARWLEHAPASGQAPLMRTRPPQEPEQQLAIREVPESRPELALLSASLRLARPVPTLVRVPAPLARPPASSARLLPPRPWRLSPAWPTPLQRPRHPQLP